MFQSLAQIRQRILDHLDAHLPSDAGALAPLIAPLLEDAAPSVRCIAAMSFGSRGPERPSLVVVVEGYRPYLAGRSAARTALRPLSLRAALLPPVPLSGPPSPGAPEGYEYQVIRARDLFAAASRAAPDLSFVGPFALRLKLLHSDGDDAVHHLVESQARALFSLAPYALARSPLDFTVDDFGEALISLALSPYRLLPAEAAREAGGLYRRDLGFYRPLLRDLLEHHGRSEGFFFCDDAGVYHQTRGGGALRRARRASGALSVRGALSARLRALAYQKYQSVSQVI